MKRTRRRPLWSRCSAYGGGGRMCWQQVCLKANGSTPGAASEGMTEICQRGLRSQEPRKELGEHVTPLVGKDKIVEHRKK